MKKYIIALLLSLLVGNGACFGGENDLFFFQENQDGPWGICNYWGEIIVSPRYESVENSEYLKYSLNKLHRVSDCSAVGVNGKWGFIDKTGKIVINNNYRGAKNFEKGMAPVSEGWSKWGLINEAGKFVVQPQYDNIYWDKKSEVWLIRNHSGEYGVIDTLGKVVAAPQFENLGYNRIYSGYMDTDLIPVKRNGKWGYIDLKRQTVIPFKYDEAAYFSDNGLAPVKIEDKWGFIAKTGEFVIEPRFQEAHNFTEDLAAVRIDYSWGFIDKTGQFVIPPKYSYVFGSFYNGVAVVGEGVIDKSGEFATKFKRNEYFCQRGFTDGLAPVEVSGEKYGYIDETGELAIPAIFDGATRFDKGFARVIENGCWGVINRFGIYVVAPKFFHIEEADDDIRIVISKTKTGEEQYRYIDNSGNIFKTLPEALRSVHKR